MSQDDIQRAIRATVPFEPLRTHLSNGDTFDVTHPDAILVGRTTSAILVDGNIHLIGNMHINHISPLAAAQR